MRPILYKPWLSVLCMCVVSGVTLSCSSVQKKEVEPSVSFELEKSDIANEFEMSYLTVENIAGLVVGCVGYLPSSEREAKLASHYAEHLANVVPNKTSVVTESHRDFDHVFVYTGKAGVCIQMSSKSFPVFPVRAFEKSVNPVGVPSAELLDWYRSIALDIARNGESRVIYKFDNGKAFVARYWADRAVELNYSGEFRDKGKWEHETVDHIFTGSIKSMTTTEYNNKMRKFPIFKGIKINQPEEGLSAGISGNTSGMVLAELVGEPGLPVTFTDHLR